MTFLVGSEDADERGTAAGFRGCLASLDQGPPSDLRGLLMQTGLLLCRDCTL